MKAEEITKSVRASVELEMNKNDLVEPLFKLLKVLLPNKLSEDDEETLRTFVSRQIRDILEAGSYSTIRALSDLGALKIEGPTD